MEDPIHVLFTQITTPYQTYQSLSVIHDYYIFLKSGEYFLRFISSKSPLKKNLTFNTVRYTYTWT